MTKTGKTTNPDVKCVPQKQDYSELDFAQGNSPIALEHCYQTILKGSYSLNENHYNNSEEGINDHQTNKQAAESKGNNIYQNASTDLTGNMSEYDIIANADNKNQDRRATYDHLHQDANKLIDVMNLSTNIQLTIRMICFKLSIEHQQFATNSIRLHNQITVICCLPLYIYSKVLQVTPSNLTK